MKGNFAEPRARTNIVLIPSLSVMVMIDKHLYYVLGHPEAWKLLALLDRGPAERLEDVRKALELHPQTFQRLLYRVQGYGLVRARATHPGKPHRGSVPIHLEISPRGKAMLEVLRTVESDAKAHRKELGLRSTELLAVA